MKKFVRISACTPDNIKTSNDLMVIMPTWPISVWSTGVAGLLHSGFSHIFRSVISQDYTVFNMLQFSILLCMQEYEWEHCQHSSIVYLENSTSSTQRHSLLTISTTMEEDQVCGHYVKKKFNMSSYCFMAWIVTKQEVYDHFLNTRVVHHPLPIQLRLDNVII